MSELPSNWTKCQVGHVARVVGGATPNAKDESNFDSKTGIPWITPADLSGYKEKYISKGNRSLSRKGYESCSANLLPQGSVIFSSRAPIGYVAIAKTDLCTSQGFKSLILAPEIESTYAYHYLKSIKQIAESQATGTTFKELSGSAVAKLPFVLAPTADQKLIADKLDELTSKTNATIKRLHKIPELIKKLRQSTLAAAYSGKLTVEFRKHEKLTPVEISLKRIKTPARPSRFNSKSDKVVAGDYALALGLPGREIPPGWQWTALVDIAKMESGHTPSRSHPEYWGGRIPWVSIPDARDGHGKTIFDTYQKTNPLGLENSAARLLPAGTVCLSRTASVGYVTRIGVPMATSQDFANWTCTEAIDPDWLKYLLVAETKAIHSFGMGTTHTTVYYPELMALHVALPPIEEQRQIVKRIDALFTLIESMEMRNELIQKKINNLIPRIYEKAFSGKLIKHNPNNKSIKLKDITEPNKVRHKTKITKEITTTQLESKIQNLPKSAFSIDELCTLLEINKGTIESQIIQLLSGPKPLLKQRFDNREKQMKFIRAHT